MQPLGNYRQGMKQASGARPDSRGRLSPRCLGRRCFGYHLLILFFFPMLECSHHTRHWFWLTIGCPALQPQAFWNSGMFCITPFTR
jgi:hypothetical protein